MSKGKNNDRKSNMNDQQFEALIGALNKPEPSENSKMLGNAWKGMSTIGLALTIWIFTTTQSLDKSSAVMEKGVQSNTEALNKLTVFSEKPRFTQDDYNLQIQPLIGELNKLNKSLEAHNSFSVDIISKFQKLEKENDNRFQSLEMEISLLKNTR